MTRLNDQAVIVTGGASGLGYAIVQRFIAEGAQVLIVDRDDVVLRDACEGLGESVRPFVGDVRSLSDMQNAVAEAINIYGKLDCVVGNAGIWDYNLSLVDMPEDKLAETFDELFHINVLGYLNIAKAALADLARSKGNIIFTVSNAGHLAGGGGPIYTASKHAVAGLVRQLAFELAPHIRVNGVAPGPISTHLRGPAALGMQDRKFPGEKIQNRADILFPIGKMPSPNEYAGAYVFLADRNDNIPTTGTILDHDGGFRVRGIGDVPRGGDNLLDKL